MIHILPLLLIGAIHAANDCFGIPDWILPGILYTETRSTYRSDGSIQYIDRRHGGAGERGCFQITPGAFSMVKRSGETFSQCDNPAFCEQIASRYLVMLHLRHGSWVSAVMAYNAGRPGTKAGRRYLNKVYKAMGMN